MVEFHVPDTADIPVLFTLLALEMVLSFDNAAILAALSNRLPREQRRKALLYGLVGAYVFRIAAIIGVVYIMQNEWLLLVGAAYLIFLSARHVLENLRHHVHGGPRMRKAPKLPMLSVFWSTVVFIELADIAFALDQILVAVALAEGDVVVIIIAALVAIVFLRIAAFYIGRIMEWFPPLETLAYVAVGFVGVKMVLAYEFPFAPWLHVEIPKSVSIAVTLGLIIAPPLVKLVVERLGGKRSAPPGVAGVDDSTPIGPDTPTEAEGEALRPHSAPRVDDS